MELVFDIGMYDGADTRYYLEQGFKVVAVEANPGLVEKARKAFEDEIKSEKLTIIHAAVSSDTGQILDLHLAGDDLGSSSTDKAHVTQKNPIGQISVESISLPDLIRAHGKPHFLKTDIEGQDHHAILALTAENRPRFVSCEIYQQPHELLDHLQSIGFTQFKAINQYNFMELNRQNHFCFRLKRKLVYLLGYMEPNYVRIHGRFFKLCHSSGPAPWESDGAWQDAGSLRKKWQQLSENNQLNGWYDLHAC